MAHDGAGEKENQEPPKPQPQFQRCAQEPQGGHAQQKGRDVNLLQGPEVQERRQDPPELKVAKGLGGVERQGVRVQATAPEHKSHQGQRVAQEQDPDATGWVSPRL